MIFEGKWPSVLRARLAGSRMVQSERTPIFCLSFRSGATFMLSSGCATSPAPAGQGARHRARFRARRLGIGEGCADLQLALERREIAGEDEEHNFWSFVFGVFAPPCPPFFKDIPSYASVSKKGFLWKKKIRPKSVKLTGFKRLVLLFCKTSTRKVSN